MPAVYPPDFKWDDHVAARHLADTFRAKPLVKGYVIPHGSQIGNFAARLRVAHEKTVRHFHEVYEALV